MIGIINYKAGNSQSVYNACKKIQVPCKYINSKDDFEGIDAVILPGVGSAAATMESLQELNLIEPLEEFVLKNKNPFLGICVGLQILFEHSEEGDVDCLGWLKGKVVKFDNKKVRVPQIGWNKLKFLKEDELVNNLKEAAYLYFVNSYHAIPQNREDILAAADYGEEFVAMIQHDNIYASQCHIEKSGEMGLSILKRFCDISSSLRQGGNTVC